MAILDLTALGSVLKTQYTQSKVYNLAYPASPIWAKMKKKTDFRGGPKQVAFQYGSPTSRAAAFAVGLGNMDASKYGAVQVTRARDYAFAQISGESIRATSTDAGALLNGLKKEIDNAIYTCGRSIANSLFSSGGGARGQIASTTTLASTTLVLADPNSVVNFEKNMVLNLGSTDGTTGAKRVGTVTVTAINRDTGTMTVSANINTITGATLGDFIFQNGDFETTRSLPTGLAGWIPKVAPVGGDNFFGLDRSSDVTRLAGLRYLQGAGGPIEETLIQAAVRLAREGGSPDVAVMNPISYGNLVTALGSKVVYDRLGSDKDPAFGFETVKLMGPKGPISIVPDFNCGTLDCWLMTMNTWSFESAGEAPGILGDDGNQILRDATTDSYIVRIGYYGNFICEAPGFNAYVAL